MYIYTHFILIIFLFLDMENEAQKDENLVYIHTTSK